MARSFPYFGPLKCVFTRLRNNIVMGHIHESCREYSKLKLLCISRVRTRSKKKLLKFTFTFAWFHHWQRFFPYCSHFLILLHGKYVSQFRVYFFGTYKTLINNFPLILWKNFQKLIFSLHCGRHEVSNRTAQNLWKKRKRHHLLSCLL